MTLENDEHVVKFGGEDFVMTIPTYLALCKSSSEFDWRKIGHLIRKATVEEIRLYAKRRFKKTK